MVGGAKGAPQAPCTAPPSRALREPDNPPPRACARLHGAMRRCPSVAHQVEPATRARPLAAPMPLQVVCPGLSRLSDYAVRTASIPDPCDLHRRFPRNKHSAPARVRPFPRRRRSTTIRHPRPHTAGRLLPVPLGMAHKLRGGSRDARRARSAAAPKQTFLTRKPRRHHDANVRQQTYPGSQELRGASCSACPPRHRGTRRHKVHSARSHSLHHGGFETRVPLRFPLPRPPSPPPLPLAGNGPDAF